MTDPTNPKFFCQKTPINIVTEPRLEFFKQFVTNKYVLHVGCSDHPLPFDPNKNLHVQLSKFTKTLDGCDPNIDLNLIPFSNNLFNDLQAAQNTQYDFILVPETIEHVDNIQAFLSLLDGCNAQQILITAPNALYKEIQFGLNQEKDHFIEIIHPDHKVWFSPYTLLNCTKSFMKNYKPTTMFLLEKQSQVAVLLEKQQ